NKKNEKKRKKGYVSLWSMNKDKKNDSSTSSIRSTLLLKSSSAASTMCLSLSSLRLLLFINRSSQQRHHDSTIQCFKALPLSPLTSTQTQQKTEIANETKHVPIGAPPVVLRTDKDHKKIRGSYSLRNPDESIQVHSISCFLFLLLHFLISIVP
ncbi:hypothetical protein RYX36_010651, partial [Vicia faba]